MMNLRFPYKLRFAALVLLCVSSASIAETYTNSIMRYRVVINPPWRIAKIPDPTADFFAICDDSVCGQDARLGFGAIFDANFKSAKLSDVMRSINGGSVTQVIRSQPMIKSVLLLREGFLKIGTHDAYEIVSRIEAKNGKIRIRHTFIIFRAGYLYTVNLGSPVESYERALIHAKKLLESYVLY
jgi:hypothetical protein